MNKTEQLEILVSKQELRQIKQLLLNENRLKRAIHREYLSCMKLRTQSVTLVAGFKSFWEE